MPGALLHLLPPCFAESENRKPATATNLDTLHCVLLFLSAVTAVTVMLDTLQGTDSSFSHSADISISSHFDPVYTTESWPEDLLITLLDWCMSIILQKLYTNKFKLKF